MGEKTKVRESGYYWVKYGDRWVVAEYTRQANYYFWQYHASSWPEHMRPFMVINEKRIPSPDEVAST